MRFEWIPLTVNVLAFSYYLVKWNQPGKTLYWLGATILTVGLLKMKG